MEQQEDKIIKQSLYTLFFTENEDAQEAGVFRAMLRGDFFLTYQYNSSNDRYQGLQLRNLRTFGEWKLGGKDITGICMTEKLLVFTNAEKLSAIRLQEFDTRPDGLWNTLSTESPDIMPHSVVIDRSHMAWRTTHYVNTHDFVQNRDWKASIASEWPEALFAGSSLWVFQGSQDLSRFKVIEMSWKLQEMNTWEISEPLAVTHLMGWNQLQPKLVGTGLPDICHLAPGIIMDLKKRTMAYIRNEEGLVMWKNRAYLGGKIFTHDAESKLSKPSKVLHGLMLDDVTERSQHAVLKNEISGVQKVWANDTWYVLQTLESDTKAIVLQVLTFQDLSSKELSNLGRRILEKKAKQ